MSSTAVEAGTIPVTPEKDEALDNEDTGEEEAFPFLSTGLYPDDDPTGFQNWWDVQFDVAPEDRVAPPLESMSDSASETSDFGFDDTGETEEEMAERQKKEDEDQRILLAEEKAKLLKEEAEREQREEVRRQEERLKEQNEEKQRLKTEKYESNLMFLLSAIEAMAKSQKLDDDNKDKFETFITTLCHDLTKEDLLKVAAAVESQDLTATLTQITSHNTQGGKSSSTVSPHAGYKGREILLNIAIACFGELVAPRFVSQSLFTSDANQLTDESKIEPYLLHSYLRVNYTYLHYLNEKHEADKVSRKKKSAASLPQNVARTFEIGEGLILGQLRRCIDTINTLDTKAKTAENAGFGKKSGETKQSKHKQKFPTILFLCHDLSYRFKSSMRPKPDFNGALESLRILKRLRNDHTKGDGTYCVGMVGCPLFFVSCCFVLFLLLLLPVVKCLRFLRGCQGNEKKFNSCQLPTIKGESRRRLRLCHEFLQLPLQGHVSPLLTSFEPKLFQLNQLDSHIFIFFVVSPFQQSTKFAMSWY